MPDEPSKTSKESGRPMTPEEMADFETRVVHGEESVPAKGIAPRTDGPARKMSPEELATFEETVVQSEDEPQPTLPPPGPLPSPD